jgi:hypothetical protein
VRPPPRQLELLAQCGALDVTLAAARVTARCCPDQFDAVLAHTCDRLRPFAREVATADADWPCFLEACETLRGHLELARSGFPCALLLPLADAFVVREPPDPLPFFLRAIAPALRFSGDAATAIAARVLAAIAGNSLYAPYMDEVARLLAVFAGADPRAFAALGWPDPVFAMLMNEYSDTDGFVDDLAGVGALYAVLVQTGLATGEVLDAIGEWATRMIAKESWEYAVVGFAVIASAVAVARAEISDEMLALWFEVIGGGYFASPYLRLLALAALQNIERARQDIAESVAAVTLAIRENSIAADDEVVNECRRLCETGVEMPIVAWAQPAFPELVDEIRNELRRSIVDV